MAVLAIAICALIVVAVEGQFCGKSAIFSSGRIIDGQEPPKCSVPWQVQIHFLPDRKTDTLLRINSAWDDSYRCAGVLIDDRHVYITPSCIYLNYKTHAEAMGQMVAVVGDHDMSDTSGNEVVRYPTAMYFPSYYTIRSQDEQLSKITYDPLDFEVLRNDQCAVIRLDQPVPLTTCTVPLCLPDNYVPECAIEKCIMVGHGFQNQAPRTPIIQFARMTALPKSVCSVLQSSGNVLPSSASTFCARTESGGIPCLFDAGSALACYNGTNWYFRGANVMDRCLQSEASMFSHIPGPCTNFMQNVMKNLVAPVYTVP